MSLVACGGGGGSNSNAQVTPTDNELSDITPYVASSPYASVMKPCVLVDNGASTCLLSDLPLLLEDAENPTVADIMSRVLVSHSWMGLRFQQVLETMPEEVLKLFTAVTIIVIDDDVRPSSYQAQTSTIYIDAAYLWLTNAEKVVITKEDDFRSSYGDELAFISLSRSVDGFEYAWEYYSLNDNDVREIEDIRLNLARVLLHELMHANDFFPPQHTLYLSLNQTIYQAYQQLLSERISIRLDASMPLQSPLLKGLAAVMYLGNTPTAAQKIVTALEVGEAMENDGANDDYAYSTTREDVAMLFSEVMMKNLFDIDRDVGYVNRLSLEQQCDDYIVEWGMRGRIGDSNVKVRAQFVVAEVYPDRDFSLFFQNLPAPLFMRSGEGWCENLALF
ncbi:MAG: hypothetical protein V3T17_10620 [Pseudomonadales bacterium]